jgi:hypothetical protein
MQITYPVARLLAEPKLFYAIANYLGGPDGATLRNAFYDLLEYGITEGEDDEGYECEFEPEEVCFQVEDDGAICNIVFDTGIMSRMVAEDGEIVSQITDEDEMMAASVFYQRIVSALEEAAPQFQGDIALCSPPTPGNGFLKSPDGEGFQGSFHLKEDPEQVYAFRVQVIDADADELRATIRPL